LRDFTLDAYQAYLKAIKKSYRSIIRFDEYFSSDPKPGQFCMIKHDVDRRPYHAVRMALLENELGVQSTYYFRAKSHTFLPDVMKQIHRLGHEIGYHYESLSDAQGSIIEAVRDFEANLKKFRAIVPVRTTAFHGRPLSRYDNRALFRLMRQKGASVSDFDLLGDANEGIDYTGILYVSDTGRTWDSAKNKIRDTVRSDVKVNVAEGSMLLTYLRSQPHPKLILLTHPERWSHNSVDWIIQALKDGMTNGIKRGVHLLRPADKSFRGGVR